MIILGPDRTGRMIHVASGRIVEIGTNLEVPSGAERHTCSDAVLALGSVNAHTHLYSGLAGLGMPQPESPPKNFVEILQKIWWRLDRALDESTLEASARLYVAEALLAGTTTLIDHHESPNFIEGSLEPLARAFETLGGRAVLTYGATERNFGREEAVRGLGECARFVWSRPQGGMIRGMVGLHASFTATDATLREAGELALALETTVHVHLAEDMADVEDAQARGYAGPLERLLAHSALPPGSIIAHGVHLDPGQVSRAKDAGLWLVQNPRSNANNKVGYPKALGASDRVGLGTDGFPATMDEEALVLASEAKTHGEPLELAMARPDRSRLIADAQLGTRLAMAQGADADLVVIGEEGVRAVLVGGEWVVKDGRLVRGEIESIREEAKVAAAKLFAKMRALPT